MKKTVPVALTDGTVLLPVALTPQAWKVILQTCVNDALSYADVINAAVLNTYGPKHGTYDMYLDYDCRCGLCKRAEAEQGAGIAFREGSTITRDKDKEVRE